MNGIIKKIEYKELMKPLLIKTAKKGNVTIKYLLYGIDLEAL